MSEHRYSYRIDLYFIKESVWLYNDPTMEGKKSILVDYRRGKMGD